MSNQNATHNRVTLLESVAAARNQILSTVQFHGLRSDDNDVNRALVRMMLTKCHLILFSAERWAAELESWGDGP